jgi:hypothetical protein
MSLIASCSIKSNHQLISSKSVRGISTNLGVWLCSSLQRDDGALGRGADHTSSSGAMGAGCSGSSSSSRGRGRSNRGWRPAVEQWELDQRRREEQQSCMSSSRGGGRSRRGPPPPCIHLLRYAHSRSSGLEDGEGKERSGVGGVALGMACTVVSDDAAAVVGSGAWERRVGGGDAAGFDVFLPARRDLQGQAQSQVGLSMVTFVCPTGPTELNFSLIVFLADGS